jgi:hypothetical protein
MLPMRRIVRGISRVYRGEKAEVQPAAFGDSLLGASSGVHDREET